MHAIAQLTKTAHAFAAVVGMVSLASLVLQYALLYALTRDTIGPAAATVRFFSYFTILSNIGVVLVAVHAITGRPGFFAHARTRAVVMLYIGVTGCVYLLVLRHLWQPQGAQWWADSGLHYATPLLYGSWWLWFAPHGRVGWNDLRWWLLFPAVYPAWALLCGAWVHEYPYPFIDVDRLGAMTVTRNALLVFAPFLLAGAALVVIDRMSGRKRRH